MPMLIIRPIAIEDLPALEALSQAAGYGLTSLPKDAKLLNRRIKASLRGFENLSDEDPPRGETYLFVLEDSATHKIVGTSGIVSKVGGFQPFYGYRLETSVHASAQLNVHKQIQTLHLIEEHDGPCEVGSLFLSPAYRHGGNGRLLSLSRFLFMADHLEYFDPVVISELRGITDNTGKSPFWDAVGHHFFDIDFPSADYLSMVNKKFIADLMPEHPIYIPLLPYSAQAVIGKVQPETEAALSLLQAEGFELTDMVDIFDAGPVVRCAVKAIRSIRDSVKAIVEEISNLKSEISDSQMLIANTQQAFRACIGSVTTTTNGVRIDNSVATALNVRIGDTVRFVSPKPSHQSSSMKEGFDAPSSI
jgi:arginine N-succinyltransferase